MEKIGIYGGTFDPVHHGHLILAREARERLKLDRLLFIPAATSPHKSTHDATDGVIRQQMIEAAISGEPGFAVDDRELRRPPPSYTYDTVRQLREEYPAAGLFLCLGEDQLAKLPTWHCFEDLRALVTFVVLARGEHVHEHEFTRIDYRIDISASDIRKRVAVGLSIRYLVPPAVEEIIRERKLYQERASSPPKN